MTGLNVVFLLVLCVLMMGSGFFICYEGRS